MRNAIARFSQVQGVADRERHNAWPRIQAAARKFDVELGAGGRRELKAGNYREKQAGALKALLSRGVFRGFTKVSMYTAGNMGLHSYR